MAGFQCKKIDCHLMEILCKKKNMVSVIYPYLRELSIMLKIWLPNRGTIATGEGFHYW